MPLYLCGTPPDALDDGQRRRIAEALTRIHCDLTGAPAMFVHVIFDESKTDYTVLGTIRAGRSATLKAELTRQMVEAIGGVVGVDPRRIGAITVDLPAAWVMEGGAVLPEPGDEAEWIAAHAGTADRPT
jgi:phenylpyruvate tautomerase PptA (4-oxalocrotonate tautomerase family)